MNVTLNNMIMQLRKCCNHPYLIQYPLMPGSDIFRVDEDLVSSCGKMMLLDRMLPVLKRNKHKVLLFSQMTAMFGCAARLLCHEG
uniref:SNF2 N-terminal domain-containing protein n=1 Tax=Ciona savignyi TaxID=51511 RepID=H2YEN5_CIOSA